MQRLSDEQLLDAVIAGEMAALATLVERYQHVLTGYLDRLVGPDWALAQDLAQETFLRVLRQHTARGNRLFKPWLYTIATNLARDHFKASATRLSTPLATEHEIGIPDDVPGPEECILRGEQRSALVDALNRLGMEYRTTLWLRFYCDLSLQEIADTLDVPLGTVKWRLSTGLRRLRDCLASSAYEEEICVRTLLASLTASRIVLLSTHIVGDVEAVASRLVVLREGRILADTTPQGLLTQANGKVWEVTIDPTTAQRLQLVSRVSTMKSTPGGVYLRIISESRPHEAAHLVEPNLEEALLAMNGQIAVD